ncbi:MAG TPA: hypothetical protein PLE19_23245 [Planctomycetota bacterium]|nr:hypothetical protein [Planctomycetota bacterium]HRR80277.1 hypothetical protein [Planctomycetota bacterium]HRT97459.1 hypothetical protein [Planctomycetota bacterium]
MSTRALRLLAIGALGLILLAAGSVPGGEAGGAGIDWNRARQLIERTRRGETLSAEDQAYLDKARAERRRLGPNWRPDGPQGQPPEKGKESVGLTPLCDLKGDARYKEMEGGLYGGGRNEPPEAQAKLAQAAAAGIAPLDPEGKPAADGRIVLLAIGMSNTTQEFSRFKQLADADPDKSPKLVIVDGAQGGKDAAAWVNSPPVWDEADRRLRAAGVTPQQVQVVWLKQALIGPGRRGEFPAHARELQRDNATILTMAKARYPNLRLAYLSSRIYAGYAVTPLNPEPYAYESAFSVRWVIEEQMKGKAELNADPARGEVKAPVALWGPYLWADGTKGRAAGDLIYNRDDLAGDGTHPSPSGRQKVAELLLRFFKADPYAKGWFLKPATQR